MDRDITPEQLTSAETADLKYCPLIGQLVSVCALIYWFEPFKRRISRLGQTNKQINLIDCWTATFAVKSQSYEKRNFGQKLLILLLSSKLLESWVKDTCWIDLKDLIFSCFLVYILNAEEGKLGRDIDSGYT